MDDELPACADCLKHDAGWSAWCDECHVLAREELARIRARLAEVGAERDSAVLLRDEWSHRASHQYARAATAEARLAAVEALCETRPKERGWGRGSAAGRFARDVLAAARGEDDRG